MALVILFFFAALDIFSADHPVSSKEQLKRLQKVPSDVIIDPVTSRLILRDKVCSPASQFVVGVHVDVTGVVTSLGKPRFTTQKIGLPKKVYEALKGLRFVPLLVGRKPTGVNTFLPVTCESGAP